MSEQMLIPLYKSLIVVISALLGAGSTFLIKLTHHKLCALISLSAGALFGAAAFVILPESFESLSVSSIILGFISGIAVFFLISKYVFHVCPACAASHFDEQTTKRFSEIVLVMITALSIHSFFDGMALASKSGEAHFEGNSIFMAVLLHKFPEGLALASLMFGAAYSRTKILLNVLFVELATTVGALTGVFLINSMHIENIFGIIMAHIAGGFIFLAIHAIHGEMLKHHTKLVLLSFLGGALMIYLTKFLGHAH